MYSRLALGQSARAAASQCACGRRAPDRAAPRSPPSAGFKQPLPDRLRRLDRNLLADDRARERGERVAAAREMESGILGDQPREHAVLLGERAGRLVPVERFGHRCEGMAVAGCRRRGCGRQAQRSCRRARSYARNVRVAGIAAGNVTLRRFFHFFGARDALKFLRLASGVVALLIAASAGRGRPGQGAAHFVSGGRDRLRSGPRVGPLLEHGQRGDLRAPADVRLSRAAREARADDRRSDARSRRRRPHVRAAPASAASISRPIRRSRASGASSSPRTTSTRSSASPIRRTARRGRS